MATMQELITGIMTDAQANVSRIDREAVERVDAIQRETGQMIAARQAQELTRLQAVRAQEFARAQAANELARQRAIVTRKQELIDDAFATAQERLTTLPAASRRRLLDTLWRDATTSIDVREVLVARKDIGFFADKRVQTQLTDGIGGFIAISADGRVRTDMHFETLLEQARVVASADVAATLFDSQSSMNKTTADRATANKTSSKTITAVPLPVVVQ